MQISFDPAKREKASQELGLDFALAGEVFSKLHVTHIDGRRDYGEIRYVTAGWLGGRMVVMVWTPRGETRHIISMRHCHANEERLWREEMEGSR